MEQNIEQIKAIKTKISNKICHLWAITENHSETEIL